MNINEKSLSTPGPATEESEAEELALNDGEAAFESADEPADPAPSALSEAPLQATRTASQSDRATAGVDLDAPELYLNRELTWLSFNWRVLAEVEDRRNPLLERLKFLAITASNLDEFFMKRIGGLKQQIVAGLQEPTIDGRTPGQQIAECYADILRFLKHQREIFDALLAQLQRQGVELLRYEELDERQCAGLREYYLKNIFPLITPLAMDPAHPFPFVSNLSLNLLLAFRAANDGETLLARVKVPVGNGIGRFMRVGRGNSFVPLEDVIVHNLDLVFPGMQLASCEMFRVTRNANTERDEEEADDLLMMIESELRDRRFAPIVRLEVAANMDPVHRGMLAAELGLDEQQDVFEVSGMLALRDLFELAALELPGLHDPTWRPVDNPRLQGSRNIFHMIRDAGSILLTHPYEAFATSVEHFLREAAEDPKVRAIKMTLYRTSSDSKILEYLCEAARNGKQVAVVVELKARFDEASNIHFASLLEDFGIHVTYGVVGLKTHCKVILVVRQDYNGLRRYSHVATGNYHPGNARIYADFGLLTASEAIGADLTELFNYLTTGYQPNRPYRKILPAPNVLKRALLGFIEREAGFGPGGLIQMKMNALEDADITRALYRAALAGVKIELIVRDTCRLRPGLAELSSSVRVVSVVGRFLEHGRIYYFRNGGAEEYYIGSADCMKRNLESRVEVVTPIEEPLLRAKLRTVLDLQLKSRRGAWEMQSDGTYNQLAPASEEKSAQQLLMDLAQAGRLEPGKPKRKRKIARRTNNGDSELMA